MNPVVEKVRSQGSIPLPDLLQSLDLERTKIIQIAREHQQIELQSVIDNKRNLAYHEVSFSD